MTRFAPSLTGHAHPGTLLSALLVWLDGRARDGRVLLRLEDLDRQRCRSEYRASMVASLNWLGLDWDGTFLQSDLANQHEAALDQLAQTGWLYRCQCSRVRIKALGRRSPDGGFSYDNRCRNQVVTEWRNAESAVRLQLPDATVEWTDESGRSYRQQPSAAFGDPVVVRRDGAVAYHLATVVDDACAGVTDVVRGHDLATSTATQIQMQSVLGYRQPRYRHHMLLLHQQGDKFAKMHGSIGYPELKGRFTGSRLCGLLAQLANIDAPSDVYPSELLKRFDWAEISAIDCEFVMP